VDRPTLSQPRGFVWAVLSLAAFVAAMFAILPVVAVGNWIGEIPHQTEMAAWSLVWGGLSLIGVLVAARLAFGAWLEVNRLGVGIAAIGIALSAIVHFVLQEWQIARFGLPEPELVGWTAGLFAVLVGLSVAVFGAFIAPKQVVHWPLAAALAGAAGVGLIVLTNVPGLRDGIADDSWPLAVWVGMSALYALCTAGLAVRRALS
jgi:hypothetical protein